MPGPEDDWNEPRTPRDPRIEPRIGRIAFFLAGLGMGLSSLSHLLVAGSRLIRNRMLWEVLRSPTWDWFVLTPATLINVFAALVLLGFRTDRHWRSRSLFLVLAQVYFFAYWCASHSRALGLPDPPAILVFDEWTFMLGRILGFAGVLTLAGLARDAAVSRRSPEAEGIYRSARGTAIMGLMLWMLFTSRVLQLAPWPPHFQPIRDFETFFIQQGVVRVSRHLRFLATLLCWKACVLCSTELERMQKNHREDDLFRRT